MLNSKELRARAWESLKGRYWAALAASVIITLLSIPSSVCSRFGAYIMGTLAAVFQGGVELDTNMLVGIVVFFVVAGIAGLFSVLISIFVNGPALVGMSNYFIKNTGEKPALSEIFAGFKTRYMKNAGTMLLVYVKIYLWMILFIVPGIIKSFEYSIVPYILADSPELSSKDAFKKAKEMMAGNKWRLFKLNISFFGWVLLCIAPALIVSFALEVLMPEFIYRELCVFLLGLMAIFVMPYMQAALAEFYMELKNK